MFSRLWYTGFHTKKTGKWKIMIAISYTALGIFISCIWLAVRFFCWLKTKKFSWKRELELLTVYICIVVVVRFTFFPFDKIDGRLQPLLFDAARAFPFRINRIPFVNLMDYPERRSALLNIIGNTTMFLPLGIVWPAVYRKLNTHKKVIAAGVGVSLCIEILQLPFFDRVSDIDDLILNSVGFLAGYGIFLLFRIIRNQIKRV